MNQRNGSAVPHAGDMENCPCPSGLDQSGQLGIPSCCCLTAEQARDYLTGDNARWLKRAVA